MKKIISFTSALLITVTAFSQSYNLNFSQVIDLTSGQTYTVPAGKALKVESVSYASSTVVYNLSYNSANYCFYKALLYNFGGITDSVTQQVYAGSACGSNCNCPSTYTGELSAPYPSATIVYPIWLKAGQVVAMPGGSGMLLTGLEFNIQ